MVLDLRRPGTPVRVAAILANLMLSPVAARSATVTGMFLEPGGASPLPGVDVVLLGVVDSVLAGHAPTDAGGRFRIDNLRPGHYRLRALLLGYQPYVRPDVVLSDSSATLDLGRIPLSVSPIGMKGVEVQGAPGGVIVASDRTIYLAKDLPGIAQTATDLLRVVPELDVDMNDRVSLRGSASLTLQFNGRNSPLKGEALTAYLRQMPASRIDRIEVVPNPSAKFDPEGLAGIVNIVTKDDLPPGLSGNATIIAGNRSVGPNARLSYQSGGTTLNGGASGLWNWLAYTYDDLRTVFLTEPASTYQLSSDLDRKNGYGNFDVSVDHAFSKRTTAYGTVTGYVNHGRDEGINSYHIVDPSAGYEAIYDRTSSLHLDARTATLTLGIQHVVTKGRREWNLEFQQFDTPGTSASHSSQAYFVPADSTGEDLQLDSEDNAFQRSLQFDATHPLGTEAKLEFGYRGSQRRNTSASLLTEFAPTPGADESGYTYRETFHSAYVTAGSKFGPVSAQVGLRGETANTSLDVTSPTSQYENDYQSLYPSANAAWEVRKGRTVRLTYSKRIERPSADYLNPNVPTLDPLDQYVGNPYLGPKYTHSFGLDLIATGSKGLLRLSPFYRIAFDNWDQFKTVDSLGVSTTTWQNASDVKYLGGTFSATLRQTKRVGGTLSVSVYREKHDATNLAQYAQQDATNWATDANIAYKASKSVDLQTGIRYRPAQTLAQGHVSAAFYSNVGARYKINDKAWVRFGISDPFDVWKYTFEMSDPSFTQTSTNRGTTRRFGLTLGWSWGGKQPELKDRRQTEEEPRQDQTLPVH